MNGLPGSGKTTLAVQLGRLMNLPVLSKDAVKEALSDVAGPAFTGPALGQVAMTVIWQLTAAADGAVIIDSFWYRPRDLEVARVGLQATGAVHAVELWCQAPPGIARARYAARTRHHVHDDHQRLADDWQNWAKDAQPLELCPVIRVDTATPVGTAALTRIASDVLSSIG